MFIIFPTQTYMKRPLDKHSFFENLSKLFEIIFTEKFREKKEATFFLLFYFTQPFIKASMHAATF